MVSEVQGGLSMGTDTMVPEVLQEALGTVLDVIDVWGQVEFAPMVLDEVFPCRGCRQLFGEGGH